MKEYVQNIIINITMLIITLLILILGAIIVQNTPEQTEDHYGEIRMEAVKEVVKEVVVIVTKPRELIPDNPDTVCDMCGEILGSDHQCCEPETDGTKKGR